MPSLVGQTFGTIQKLRKRLPWAMLTLNSQAYLKARGLDVFLGHNNYAEGHQSGLELIVCDRRLLANGDLRLEIAPGQFQAIPKQVERGAEAQMLWTKSVFPDEEKNCKGFNPILYPDLQFGYTTEVSVVESVTEEVFELSISLDRPLPDMPALDVGFSIELFPGAFFDRGWYMEEAQNGQTNGIFPRQANGPVKLLPKLEGSWPDKNWPGAESADLVLQPLARGKSISLAPDSPEYAINIQSLCPQLLELHDGRLQHSNGWFILRSPLPLGKAGEVLRWRFSIPKKEGWFRPPAIQINQAGYHSHSTKRAILEFDPNDPAKNSPARLYRIAENGRRELMLEGGSYFGPFLRYEYQSFDFSRISQEGLYLIECAGQESSLFKIDASIYERHIWSPVLEHFLPIQMCHMRVEEGYRVWHGACHLEDAIMADTDINYFDGYTQGASTLCTAKSGDAIAELNQGGWHDAGDFDLRIESQANTVYGLSLAWEYFQPDWDTTTIDQEQRLVRILRPDGEPDILQQIEHGLLSILGAWRSLGRLYRGIIEDGLADYVLIGDPLNHKNTRLVFTEDNPARELETAAALATASRALWHWKPALAQEALATAKELYRRVDEKAETLKNSPAFPHIKGNKIAAAVELFLALQLDGKTKEAADYIECILAARLEARAFIWAGPTLARTLSAFKKQPELFATDQWQNKYKAFEAAFLESAAEAAINIQEESHENPYGLPWKPHVWGAGWGIQRFGKQLWILCRELPEVFNKELVQFAYDFVLGCHPGKNTASYISGVGTKSVLVGYGLNRADWSYLPGGSVSGTGLIGPDFPELLDWPFLWQQTEYVLGGGTSDWLFLALAIKEL